MPLLYTHECKVCAKRVGPNGSEDLPVGWNKIAVWKETTPPTWSKTVMICDTCSITLLGAIVGGD